jgi:hypothetical protein
VEEGRYRTFNKHCGEESRNSAVQFPVKLAAVWPAMFINVSKLSISRVREESKNVNELHEFVLSVR